MRCLEKAGGGGCRRSAAGPTEPPGEGPAGTPGARHSPGRASPSRERPNRSAAGQTGHAAGAPPRSHAFVTAAAPSPSRAAPSPAEDTLPASAPRGCGTPRGSCGDGGSPRHGPRVPEPPVRHTHTPPPPCPSCLPGGPPPAQGPASRDTAVQPACSHQGRETPARSLLGVTFARGWGCARLLIMPGGAGGDTLPFAPGRGHLGAAISVSRVRTLPPPRLGPAAGGTPSPRRGVRSAGRPGPSPGNAGTQRPAPPAPGCAGAARSAERGAYLSPSPTAHRNPPNPGITRGTTPTLAPTQPAPPAPPP